MAAVTATSTALATDFTDLNGKTTRIPQLQPAKNFVKNLSGNGRGGLPKRSAPWFRRCRSKRLVQVSVSVSFSPFEIRAIRGNAFDVSAAICGSPGRALRNTAAF